jgi:hypothetical protein
MSPAPKALRGWTIELEIRGRPMRVVITTHARERFIERVRPGLDLDAAGRELCCLLASSSISHERPPQLGGSSTPTFAYVKVADVYFTLQHAEQNDVLFLTTTIVPAIRAARPRQLTRRNRRNLKHAARDEARRDRRTRDRRRAHQTRRTRRTR